MIDFMGLWYKLKGENSDDALANEQKKLATVREAVKLQKEKDEVRRQLQAARKERKELESSLGTQRKIKMYIALGALLLVFILIVRSCM